MSKRQALHTKVRASKEWKEFRNLMKNSQRFDAITGKPLYAGWNLHHLCLKDEEYANLEPDNFVCLNRKSHEMIHFLYGKNGKGWRQKLASIACLLEMMENLNK